MAKYVTHKSTREGRATTLERRTARNVKHGAVATTRTGRTRTTTTREA